MRAAGEAVCYAARKASTHRLEHCDELLVCVALVQEHRFADLSRELELRREGASLRVAWRVVAEEIEAAFADGDELRCLEQRPQRRRRVRVELGGMMRVHAGRRAQGFWV